MILQLDVVIDNMASAVQLLEDASVKMNRMSPDDAKAFQLDICLGGSSEVLPRKSIERSQCGCLQFSFLLFVQFERLFYLVFS
jgi:hypothetical protein